MITSRMQTVFAVFVIGFFSIILRLGYWQIIVGDKLRIEAAAQYMLSLIIPATRGTIVAADGSPLAMNQPGYLVYAQRKEIEDVAEFIQKISPLAGIDEASLAADLADPQRVWLPLLRKADTSIVEKLEALDLPGLGFEKESKRYYPEASMAAHLLGFVGSDQNGNDLGYFGLEGYYDRELRGKDGKLTTEKDVRGTPILVGNAMRIEPENGRTLTLWLDRTIQQIVEKKLLAGMEKYGAKEGTVVIMDPATGGILAMAHFPNYDPTHFADFDKTYYKNPAVGSSYEPGSTFKVLVMAAGINEKVITPGTTMNEDGPITVGEYKIRTWNNEYNGTTSMTDALVHSSNVGMVFVQRKLGEEKLLKYIHAFGFGVPSGIDLEDEQSPELRKSSEWREIDYATASFGQGIAVTPLQMVRAVAALANGGWLMEPHMVKEVVSDTGKRSVIAPRKLRQVISKTAASLVTEMMVAAVEEGEAKWAKPKGYRVAGKTGTAQIPVAGHYDDKKTIASFVGFAPADKPRFVMLVTLREPTSSQWGSETAAPLFFNIAREIFTYYGISPQ